MINKKLDEFLRGVEKDVESLEKYAKNIERDTTKILSKLKSLDI